MRHLGTFMLFAAAAMLVVPVWWERTHGDAAQADPALFPGRSTLTAKDLEPQWRGPPR